MIKHIDIINYKSIPKLQFDLGRINVFIGENGSGKTSILEALAFGSAASQNKLDNEFLTSRGIRVLEPRIMKSSFKNSLSKEGITIGYKNENNKGIGFKIDNEEKFPFEWIIEKKYGNVEEVKKVISNFFDHDRESIVQKIIEHSHELGIKVIEDTDVKTDRSNLNLENEETKDKIKKFIKEVYQEKVDEKIQNEYISKFGVGKFLVYAPENYFLRRFEEEGQIKPLGIRGEGLFSHLLELSKETPEIINKISEHLKVIDWFEEFSIPTNLVFSERKINIKDKYLKDNIEFIDQRSSNEGFLYLLFYITLFLSKYTPNFLSIDNIDNSLNPKLCIKLVQTLIQLSKENDKQAILTTHNPAILDGLDLSDDEQRLFVVYRNADGHTTLKRIKPPKIIKDVEPVRLSEAFVRGYLGGLPKNF